MYTVRTRNLLLIEDMLKVKTTQVTMSEVEIQNLIQNMPRQERDSIHPRSQNIELEELTT